MNLIELIKRDEGFSGVPYKCTAGKTTIGYGRNLEANPMTPAEAEILLTNDINHVRYSLRDRLGLDCKLDVNKIQPREAVLINMAFQMGITGLMKFRKTLEQYALQNWDNCANEMLDSKWAQQTPNRAKRLSEQMRTGEWQ